MMLTGIEVNGINYDAILYPKIGLIDRLEKDLQDGLVFPVLSKKLEINKSMAIIEAYVD